MKVMKWIVRYAFLALLAAIAGFWWVYCNNTLASLEATAASPEFIEKATTSFSEAVALLDRIQEFKDLRLIGIIGVAVVAFLLILLILWNIFGKRISEKTKNKYDGIKQKMSTPRPVKEKAPVPARTAEPIVTAAPPVPTQDAVAPEKAFFCPYCGRKHDKRPAFCAGCGQPIEKK